MKLLVFNGDLGGCYEYRVRIPLEELKAFGVEHVCLPELPNNPWGDDFTELLRLIEQFDLVIVQRCYRLAVVKMIRTACDLLGKKMVFETDDDYFNLPPSNPCFPEMQAPGVIPGYEQILRMADMLTVSTEELRRVLWMYNKNIVVLENNIPAIPCGTKGAPVRAYSKETPDANGRVQIPNMFGLVSCPSWWEHPQTKAKNRVVRVGYTGTPSHHEDFMTIHNHLERFMEKNEKHVWLIFIGDRWFYDKMTKGKGRIIHIPVSQYSLYTYHIRNLDVGLAPLAPNVFNMSKSPIKAVEYGSWGVAPVLPHYITYTRDFTNRHDCLTYYNGREFVDCLEEMVFNPQLRENISMNARDTVAAKRVEKTHAAKRFAAYSSLLQETKPIKSFAPEAVV